MSSSMYYDIMLEEGVNAQNVMKIVYYKSTDIYKYLMRALDRVRDKKYKAQWIEIKPKVLEKKSQMRKEVNSKKVGFSGRLEIYEEDLDLEDTILKEFNSAKFIYINEECNQHERIRILDSDPKNAILTLEERPPLSKIFTRQSTYQLSRQLNALRTLQNSPRPHHRPIIRLFENKDKSSWPKFDFKQVNEWYLLTDKERPGIEVQRNFVQKALSTPDFAILEGPPGTGKTTTICELILQII